MTTTSAPSPAQLSVRSQHQAPHSTVALQQQAPIYSKDYELLQACQESPISYDKVLLLTARGADPRYQWKDQSALKIVSGLVGQNHGQNEAYVRILKIFLSKIPTLQPFSASVCSSTSSLSSTHLFSSNAIKGQTLLKPLSTVQTEPTTKEQVHAEKMAQIKRELNDAICNEDLKQVVKILAEQVSPLPLWARESILTDGLDAVCQYVDTKTHVEIAKHLLEKGAKVNGLADAQTAPLNWLYNDTELMYKADNEDRQNLLKLLIEFKVDLKKRDLCDHLPIDGARSKKSLEIFLTHSKLTPEELKEVMSTWDSSFQNLKPNEKSKYKKLFAMRNQIVSEHLAKLGFATGQVLLQPQSPSSVPSFQAIQNQVTPIQPLTEAQAQQIQDELIKACLAKDTAKVREIISNDPLANAPLPTKEKVLTKSLESICQIMDLEEDHVYIAANLLFQGANVNGLPDTDISPIDWLYNGGYITHSSVRRAETEYHRKLLALLIEYKVDLGKRDNSGNLPIQNSRSEESVKMMFNARRLSDIEFNEVMGNWDKELKSMRPETRKNLEQFFANRRNALLKMF